MCVDQGGRCCNVARVSPSHKRMQLCMCVATRRPEWVLQQALRVAAALLCVGRFWTEQGKQLGCEGRRHRKYADARKGSVDTASMQGSWVPLWSAHAVDRCPHPGYPAMRASQRDDHCVAARVAESSSRAPERASTVLS